MVHFLTLQDRRKHDKIIIQNTGQNFLVAVFHAESRGAIGFSRRSFPEKSFQKVTLNWG